ncbi:unnamed protein product [Phytomonas sp. Hart1]|nr:unnamed protein product [Phytomonas sp. Hart1]|eukprot:CCW67542.1 unnamed protein product [Phytomonas sp. isolate Hart1]
MLRSPSSFRSGSDLLTGLSPKEQRRVLSLINTSPSSKNTCTSTATGTAFPGPWNQLIRMDLTREEDLKALYRQKYLVDPLLQGRPGKRQYTKRDHLDLFCGAPEVMETSSPREQENKKDIPADEIVASSSFSPPPQVQSTAVNIKKKEIVKAAAVNDNNCGCIDNNNTPRGKTATEREGHTLFNPSISNNFLQPKRFGRLRNETLIIKSSGDHDIFGTSSRIKAMMKASASLERNNNKKEEEVKKEEKKSSSSSAPYGAGRSRKEPFADEEPPRVPQLQPGSAEKRQTRNERDIGNSKSIKISSAMWNGVVTPSLSPQRLHRRKNSIPTRIREAL